MKNKFLLTLVLILGVSAGAWAQGEVEVVKNVVYNNGVTMGSALAIAISWSRNRSILWAIVHGILSWLYVIYYYFALRDKPVA